MVTRNHSYFQTKWLKYFKLTFITTLDSPYWNNQTMTKAIFYWVEEDKFCNDGPFILILLFLIPCFILMKFILSWHDLITVWFIGLDDPIITSIYHNYTSALFQILYCTLVNVSCINVSWCLLYRIEGNGQCVPDENIARLSITVSHLSICVCLCIFSLLSLVWTWPAPPPGCSVVCVLITI